MRQIGDPIPRRFKYAPSTTEKPCTGCKLVKPLDAFSVHPHGALGRNPKCKECIRANGLRYTKSRLEALAQRTRPDMCDCCGQLRTLRRAMHWDHDHATGLFRGWLCHYCNSALGAVKDNVEQLQQLIDYLNRGGGPSK
jgi:hypothetical protein